MQETYKTLVLKEVNYQEYLHKERTELYVINNIDLFKSRADKDPAYVTYLRTAARNFYLSPERKRQVEAEFIERLIEKPMTEFIQLLVERGCNPHATVQKLEFYRKLDEHKQHLLMMAEQRSTVQAVQDTLMQSEPMQIDTTGSRVQAGSGNREERKVKTRTEVLAEQKYERKLARKARKKGKAEKDPNDPRTQLRKKLKDFYAQQGFTPQFKTENGRQVEIEYDKEHGLKNAFHIAMAHPQLWLTDLLLRIGIDCDTPDFKNRTPFNVGIDFLIARQQPSLDASLEKLISKGVNIDYADEANQTPFLKLYNSRLQQASESLRLLGANINQMSKSGIFALKIALMRRDDAEIKRLVSLGANINQIDQHGRNLLHFAINMSSASADATFETEQLLINLGVELNVRDCRGRVPLHYAFVKMKDHANNSQIDPIETISSLCAKKELEIEVADKWLKTPLHYAAQRSATISSLYILQRGARLESKDIYGNTPLGVALKNQHFNYGIILIQKSADVKVPVHEEFPKRVAKMWKEEEARAAKATGGDAEMQEEGEAGRDSKKHRKMFTNPGASFNINNIFFGFGAFDSDDD